MHLNGMHEIKIRLQLRILYLPPRLKVKLSLYLTKHRAMQTFWRVEV